MTEEKYDFNASVEEVLKDSEFSFVKAWGSGVCKIAPQKIKEFLDHHYRNYTDDSNYTDCKDEDGNILVKFEMHDTRAYSYDSFKRWQAGKLIIGRCPGGVFLKYKPDKNAKQKRMDEFLPEIRRCRFGEFIDTKQEIPMMMVGGSMSPKVSPNARYLLNINAVCPVLYEISTKTTVKEFHGFCSARFESESIINLYRKDKYGFTRYNHFVSYNIETGESQEIILPEPEKPKDYEYLIEKQLKERFKFVNFNTWTNVLQLPFDGEIFAVLFRVTRWEDNNESNTYRFIIFDHEKNKVYFEENTFRFSSGMCLSKDRKKVIYSDGNNINISIRDVEQIKHFISEQNQTESKTNE
jgi:hypothetical protein